MRNMRNMGKLIAIFFLFIASTNIVFPHSPHDDVFDLEFSPNFSEDRRAYAVVRSTVFASSDGGVTWARKIRGFDHKHMLVALDVGAGGQTIYVTSLGDGVYRSRDAGETWARVNSGLESLVIDLVSASPRGTDHALVADTEGGLYVTFSAGSDWIRVDGKFGKVTAIAFVPGEAAGLLMADHKGRLYRSRDGGRSWNEMYRAERTAAITSLAVSRNLATAEAPVVLAGTEAGRVLRSTDGGRSFEEAVVSASGQPVISIALSPEFVNDRVAFASVWSEGVYYSGNGGKEWVPRKRGLTRDQQAEKLGRPDYSHLGVSPNFRTDRTVFVAGFDGLFQSNNSGRDWKQAQVLSSMNIMGLSISPDYADDNTLALTTWLWGTYMSNDGGDTWRARNQGLSDPYARDEGLVRLFNVTFSPYYRSDGTLFISTWYDLFKSNNRGLEWARVPQVEVPSDAGRYRASYFAVSPNLNNDGTVFAGTKTGLILRSTDRGETFKTLKALENMIGSVAVAPSFSGDATVFVGDTHGVHISRDAGENWEFYQLLESTLHFRMPISPAYPQKASVEWKEHVLDQREKAYAVKIAVSPAYSEDETVFAGTADGFKRSLDGGRTWHRLGSGSFGEHAYIEAVAVSPEFDRDGTLIVSVRGKGHFRSRDAGDSFSVIGAELMSRNKLLAHYVGMVPKFPSIVFSPAYTSDRTLFGFSGTELFRSRDQGETWEAMSTPSVSFKARAHAWSRYWLERVTELNRRQKAKGAAIFMLLAAGGLFGMRVWKSRRRDRDA